ncbi:BMP family ABC transporter substrate-binding protein [Mangrovimicrobium sediminis]|uniref:BMP family ABC transporter substrate-binding protein n=1 Tax=Mangrovimicrobium sediminis TaxID=2562682 RepID=A0A4Z0M567_9GAMM|nr:BMP family ABC transporter substrate-binding protein [Haliea sp. SAOS-164]TGD74614.1 BMP family ABC transporter substrate-binding protein [Haliea sp. SAOS-164]
MRKHRSPLLRRLLAAAMLLPALAGAQAPVKVAFMHENPVGQGGWTLSHELARKELEAYFGERIVTTALDGVPPGGDAERVMTKLARDGNQLVFATSFGFMNSAVRVARRFPKVKFEHASGYTTARNLGTYQIRAYQGRYLAGYAAALASKTGRLGYVGSFPIPEVLRGINAYTIGARAARPDITVEVVWINTWSDAGRSREAADLLIARNADVITHHTETAAAIQAAEQAGVWSVGYQTDRSAYAPQHHLVSIAHNWFPIYKRKVQSVIDGTWTSNVDWVGVEEDATQLVGWGPQVPEDIRAAVAAERQRMLDGELNVWRGPLKDSSGQERVAAGAIPADDALIAMEWLLEGIIGGVPN